MKNSAFRSYFARAVEYPKNELLLLLKVRKYFRLKIYYSSIKNI